MFGKAVDVDRSVSFLSSREEGVEMDGSSLGSCRQTHLLDPQAQAAKGPAFGDAADRFFIS
jgi:hypothetical protein